MPTIRKPKSQPKCRCREAKRHRDCSYCGSGLGFQVCGMCRKFGIDGHVIRGTEERICAIHKTKGGAR
jgi:hypothetical protein